MISSFDTADQAIEKTIVSLCKKLDRINPANDEYTTIVKSIARLRSSLNAPVISDEKE